VIYDIDHLTAYSYEAPVTSASLALLLTPRGTLSQRCLWHEIRISPEPEHATSHRDFYGNVVDLVSIDTPHTELHIRSRARVEVTPGAGSCKPAPT
jgi:transglutaminase-like putative cysteine protease